LNYVADVIPMVEWKKTPTSSSPRGSVHLQVIHRGPRSFHVVKRWSLTFAIRRHFYRRKNVAVRFAVVRCNGSIRYDTSHPFLEGTFIYQICVATVDD